MKPIRWTRHPRDWWCGAGHISRLLDMKTVGILQQLAQQITQPFAQWHGGADRFRSSLGLRAATQGCTVVPPVFMAYTVLQAHFTVAFFLQVQNPDAVMARGFPLCCAQFGFWSSPLHDFFWLIYIRLRRLPVLVQPVRECGALEAPLAHLVPLGCRWQWLSGGLWWAWSRIYRWVSIYWWNTSKLDLTDCREKKKLAEDSPKITNSTHPPRAGFGIPLLQLFWSWTHSCSQSGGNVKESFAESLTAPKVLGWGSFTDRLWRRCRTSVLQGGHRQNRATTSQRQFLGLPVDIVQCCRCFCLLFGVHLWFWRIFGNSCYFFHNLWNFT